MVAGLPERSLARILEGVLLAADSPLQLRQLADLFDAEERPSTVDLKAALTQLEADCEHRACCLEQVAGGYRLRLRDELNPYLERLRRERPPRYSRALMETFAAIAYRQPLTRGDIESLRGVSLSPSIMRTLLEREWVRVVGYRESPGRPALYATTQRFLNDFGLRKLSDLPPLPALAEDAKEDAELHSAATDASSVVPDTLPPTVPERLGGELGEAEPAADNALPLTPPAPPLVDPDVTHIVS